MELAIDLCLGSLPRNLSCHLCTSEHLARTRLGRSQSSQRAILFLPHRLPLQFQDSSFCKQTFQACREEGGIDSSEMLEERGNPRSSEETARSYNGERDDGTSSDQEDADEKSARKCDRIRHVKVISKTKLKNMQRQEREREKKHQVVHAFQAFYHAQYGERWPDLFYALQAEPRSCCLVNRFADSETLGQNFAEVQNLTRLVFINLLAYESTRRFAHPDRDFRNVYTYYLLDAASVMATEALEIHSGDHVLDLCAAPGGKALAILQQLGLPQGMLTANEPSDDRRRRLWKLAKYDYKMMRKPRGALGLKGYRDLPIQGRASRMHL